MVSDASLSNHTQNKRQLSIPGDQAGKNQHNSTVASATVISVSEHEEKAWIDSRLHGSWFIEDASRH